MPLWNAVRLLRGPRAVQRTALLRPADRTPRRRRAHVLVDLVNEHCPFPGSLMVEVGAVGGATSAHVARYCPQLSRIYTVDIARPDVENDVTRDVEQVHFLHMESLKAATQFEEKSIDLVFIDADHSLKAVLADLEAWYPKIKTGGVVSGHDYGSRNHPGVRPAVDFFFARLGAAPVETDADKVWWTIK